MVCEGESTLQSGILHTIASLDKWYNLYTTNGSGGEIQLIHCFNFITDSKTMQQYKNVIIPCLIRCEPEQEVLELLPLP